MPRKSLLNDINSASSDQFPGFRRPQANYFRLPNNWTDITARMETWAEHKVVEYVLRHTWGYREYGIKRQITLDEFMSGRKRKDGSRIDRGTGLGKKAIIDGIRAAINHGFLEEEVDGTDRARVKKYYSLRMLAGESDPDDPEEEEAQDDEGFDEDTAGVRLSNPGVRRPNISGSTTEQRTEKDTLERHSKNNTNTGGGVFTETDDFSNTPRSSNEAGSGQLPTPTSTPQPRNGPTALPLPLDNLIEHGVSAAKAKGLVKTFPEERITRQVEHLAFLIDAGASPRQRAAWLVRAIEEDYQLPEGFKTSAQREDERRRREEERQRLLENIEHYEAEERRQRQKGSLAVPGSPNSAVSSQTAPGLSPRPENGSEQPFDGIWAKALELLRQQVSATNFSVFVASTRLAVLEKDRAIVAAPQNFIRDYLETRLSSTVQAALTKVVGQRVNVEFVTVEESSSEEEENQTTPAEPTAARSRANNPAPAKKSARRGRKVLEHHSSV